MRVIARHTLVDLWRHHRETEPPLRDWLSVVRRADWWSMADVKAGFAKASIIDRERVVFDVLGANYRLVVAIKFSAKIVFIKFIGTRRRVRPDWSGNRQPPPSEAAMTPAIKPIRDDQDHAAALAAIEGLWPAEPGTPEHDHLEVLPMLVDAYESRRWPIELADPVDLISYVMEQRGLTGRIWRPRLARVRASRRS